MRATSDRRSSGGGRIVAAIHGSLASIGWLQDSSDDLYVVRLTASGWSEAESIETLDGNFIYEPTLGMDAAGNVTVAFKMAPDTTFYVNRFDVATNAWSGASASPVGSGTRCRMVSKRGRRSVSGASRSVVHWPSRATA